MPSQNEYKVEPFTEKETALFRSIFKADPIPKMVRVNGCVVPETFPSHEPKEFRNLPLRKNDVFVVSYPRSGTTWTQELVWLVVNNLDFEKAKATPLQDRFPFLESGIFLLLEKELQEKCHRPDEQLAMVPEGEPRFIKTHLPLNLLPEGALDTTKVVYVARDPRDVAVSYYHFVKDYQFWGFDTDFKTYFYELFCKDLLLWAPYFAHIKQAWAERNHPNLLFLFYEELTKDLKGTAKKVSKFLGKEYSEEQYDLLCDHLQFNNFQHNKSIVPEEMPQNFVRKGVAGGWRAYFDEEMCAYAPRWMDDNLRDTTLTFPTL